MDHGALERQHDARISHHGNGALMRGDPPPSVRVAQQVRNIMELSFRTFHLAGDGPVALGDRHAQFVARQAQLRIADIGKSIAGLAGARLIHGA
jgi:hypothetical protein